MCKRTTVRRPDPRPTELRQAQELEPHKEPRGPRCLAVRRAQRKFPVPAMARRHSRRRQEELHGVASSGDRHNLAVDADRVTRFRPARPAPMNAPVAASTAQTEEEHQEPRAAVDAGSPSA